MNNELKKLQLTELEILKVIDDFCNKHNIEYSLYAGTMLGAVRHHGFIPWDDDLDICMSRENYDRFIAEWNCSAPKGYILQNKDNTPAFSQSFSKIRKENTTFFQELDTPGQYHMGIFVDVFPIDRMPNGVIKKQLFYFRCMKYQLLTREFIPPKGNLFIRIVSKMILWITPKKSRQRKRNNLLDKITQYNNESCNNMVAIETVSTFRTPLPMDLLDTFISIDFEDGIFKCSKKYEEYLRIKYSDYMQLPPVDERTWTHHPIIIDFEHNYEELESEA